MLRPPLASASTSVRLGWPVATIRYHIIVNEQRAIWSERCPADFAEDVCSRRGTLVADVRCSIVGRSDPASDCRAVSQTFPVDSKAPTLGQVRRDVPKRQARAYFMNRRIEVADDRRSHAEAPTLTLAHHVPKVRGDS